MAFSHIRGERDVEGSQPFFAHVLTVEVSSVRTFAHLSVDISRNIDSGGSKNLGISLSFVFGL